MRILVDPDELDAVSIALQDAAAAVQELASLTRAVVNAIDMPTGTSHAVTPTVDAAATALRSVADRLVEESGGLRSRASCCASNEAAAIGGLPILAADGWASTTAAADAALGLDRSALAAALTGAILTWQASTSPGAPEALTSAILSWQASGSPGAPDALTGAILSWQASGSGTQLIDGGSIAAFDQLLGARPGAIDLDETMGLGDILSPVANPASGEYIDRQRELVNNAGSVTDTIYALGFVPTGTATPRVPGSPDEANLIWEFERRGNEMAFPGLTQPGGSLGGGILNFLGNSIVSGTSR